VAVFVAALTRARETVIVVGPEAAIRTALQDMQGDVRLTSLHDRLAAAAAAQGLQRCASCSIRSRVYTGHQACTNMLQSLSTSRRSKQRDDKPDTERKMIFACVPAFIVAEHGAPVRALTLSPACECCRCTPVVYGNGVPEAAAEAIVSRAVATSLQQASEAEQQSTQAGQSDVHSTAAGTPEVPPPKSAGRSAPSKFRGGLSSRRLANGSPALRPQSGARKWVVAGKGGLSDEDVAA